VNETLANEKPAVAVAPPPRETIERLHLDGFSNRAIAVTPKEFNR
jgi:hypothetical protein